MRAFLARCARTAGVAAVAVGVVSRGGLARAEGGAKRGPQAVEVEFQAFDGCPSAASFGERLAGRSANLRPAQAGDEGAGSKVAVRVTRRGTPRAAESHGELVVHFADGTEAKRTVDGDSCESVVDALALMSVMALDPEAARNPPRRPPEPPEPPPPAPAPAPPSSPDAGPTLDTVAGAHLSFGFGGAAAFGVGPVVVPDLAAFVELARAPDGADAGVWAPSVRVGFDYGSTGDATVSGVTGGVRLARVLGTVDGCPVRWAAGPLRLSPCARFEAGGMSASGLGQTPDRSSERPWVAIGAFGAVRYVSPLRVFVELTGGVRAPLERDRFYFEPSNTVYRAPAAAGFAGGSLGFTIL